MKSTVNHHASTSDPEFIRSTLAATRLFLMDLDGTTYVENRLIPGATGFLDRLTSTGRSYVFLTNNSSRSAADYLRKITSLGIRATDENIFTSGQATALHLTRTGARPRILLVGTASLAREMASYGITLVDRTDDQADYVVIGYDTELEYWKLEKACRLIDNGVTFLATHPDLVCPVEERRSIPDCGSFCQMIRNATGKDPVTVFGKPDKRMVEVLCERRGIPAAQVAMVGDRLYTDIALGVNAGIVSICVLTGESTIADIAVSSHQPTIVVNSIADLTSCL